MSAHKRWSWLPFSLLVPLAAALLFLDEIIPMPSACRTISLLGIVILISVLAVSWIERHPRLFEDDRPDTLTYRVVSSPWSVFQRHSCEIEDDGVFEAQDARHDPCPQPPRLIPFRRQEE